MSALQLTTILAKLPELLALTPEDLSKMTVKQLKAKAELLQIQGVYKLKKKQLIKAISSEVANLNNFANISAEEKITAAKVIKQAKQNTDYSIPISELGQKTYARLREIVTLSSNLDEIKERCNGLVAAVAAAESKEYEFSTIKSRRTELKKFLDSTAATETPLVKSNMLDTSAYFYSQLLSFQREESLELNRKYKSAVQQKNRGEKTKVKLNNLIDKCLNTLELLDNGKNPKWTELSIALALGTGRRMAEIHSLGNFEYVSDNRIYFSGQAKTREAEGSNSEYEIISLFPARLMIKALKYLEECGRRLPKEVQEENPKACNKAYAMALSRSLNKYPNVTYKSLRALYADILWQSKKEEYSRTGIEKHSLYSQWLGHIDFNGKIDSTFMSYMIYAIDDFDQFKDSIDIN